MIFCTDKKENKIFLVYREIQISAKSYMRIGCKVRKGFLIYDFAPDPSEFSNIRGKFSFLFISAALPGKIIRPRHHVVKIPRCFKSCTRSRGFQTAWFFPGPKCANRRRKKKTVQTSVFHCKCQKIFYESLLPVMVLFIYCLSFFFFIWGSVFLGPAGDEQCNERD
jgi:hypothetical protein